MKPVKNQFQGCFQVGERLTYPNTLEGELITGMIPCDSGHCEKTYLNFKMCGGFRRLVKGIRHCCFFRCDPPFDAYLTDRPGGLRLQ
jgi:hypothetical protein